MWSTPSSKPLRSKHQDLCLEFCCQLLNNLKHHSDHVIFSDKKTFTVDPTFNKQNDCIICFDKEDHDLRNVSKTKHLASIMMLGVMASTGEKMAPIWFPVWYRLTAADYLEVLSDKVLP